MKRRPQSKNGRITLRDILAHIGHMGQRIHRMEDGMKRMEKNLGARIEANTTSIQAFDRKFDVRIDDLEEHLTRRIDALDEDLTATIMDTITIRKHVGMPVPEDA